MKIKDHILVLYQFKDGNWKYEIDSVFSDISYRQMGDAVLAAFEGLEKRILHHIAYRVIVRILSFQVFAYCRVSVDYDEKLSSNKL